VRRKAGRLLSIEEAILDVGLRFQAHASQGLHGFAAAKLIQEAYGGSHLTAHGTLYKALSRLERAGLLRSEWEDPGLAAGEGRPRRRLYHVTDLGQKALALARAAAGDPTGAIDAALIVIGSEKATYADRVLAAVAGGLAAASAGDETTIGRSPINPVAINRPTPPMPSRLRCPADGIP